MVTPLGGLSLRKDLPKNSAGRFGQSSRICQNNLRRTDFRKSETQKRKIDHYPVKTSARNILTLQPSFPHPPTHKHRHKKAKVWD